MIIGRSSLLIVKLFSIKSDELLARECNTIVTFLTCQSTIWPMGGRRLLTYVLAAGNDTRNEKHQLL